MSEQDAERYNEKAEECLYHAERTSSPVDRAVWLRLANEWLKLAQEYERDSR